MKKCPECGSEEIIWDGVAYIWLCLEADCFWSGDEKDLKTEEANVLEELLKDVDTSYFFDKTTMVE